MKYTAMRIACLAALALGIVWNLLFSLADWSARRNRPEATRLALRLVPGNAAFAAQLADEVYASNPAEAQSLLQRAVERNPYNAPNLIHLALLREAANDVPGAEAALLRAADVDKTFLPSWSLANFYFRQNKTDRFWLWGEKAAQMIPDDPTALFRLAWYASPNAPEVEERLQLKSRTLQSQFVNFVMAQGDTQAVAEATSRLAAMPVDRESTQTLLQACDWLLGQKRPDLAFALWRQIAPRAGYAAPGADSAVTNADFARSPVSHGFDWHLTTPEGVTSFWNEAPNALGFEFSGNEPDHFELLRQVVPVSPGTEYVLAADYSTNGVTPGSGLRWQITGQPTGVALAKSESLAAEQAGTSYTCFRTPEGSGFVDIALAYQREPGTVRIEGKLTLRKVRLERGACPEKPHLAARLPGGPGLNSRSGL